MREKGDRMMKIAAPSSEGFADEHFGTARAAAEAFARGGLSDSGLGCTAHGEARGKPGHECSH